MKLFLIRHGETVDNVAGVYAGITNSALTNHGVLQTKRLGQHLATRVKVSHIFSSDLQRAFKTAEAIRLAQENDSSNSIAQETKQLEILREQDFGFYEGKVFFDRPKNSDKNGRELHYEAHKDIPGFKDIESKEDMRARCNIFVHDHLLPLFDTVSDDTNRAVIVVAHGIILSHLWRAILYRFPRQNVSVQPGVLPVDGAVVLEHLGGWSNTGYLELELKPITKEGIKNASLVDSRPDPGPSITKVADISLAVKAVNSVEHLKGLKKTRGGIGSSRFDEGQQSIETFFKKRKIG